MENELLIKLISAGILAVDSAIKILAARKQAGELTESEEQAMDDAVKARMDMPHWKVSE